jgi:hypothetical protein
MSAPPLPRLLESKAYERAVTAWNGPRITIISPADKPIAHIPLDFVIRGGDNTWAYVVGVVRQLVVEDDGRIFDGAQAVSPADPPFAGTFVYSARGKRDLPSPSGLGLHGDVVPNVSHDPKSERCALLFWTSLYNTIQASGG